MMRHERAALAAWTSCAVAALALWVGIEGAYRTRIDALEMERATFAERAAANERVVRLWAADDAAAGQLAHELQRRFGAVEAAESLAPEILGLEAAAGRHGVAVRGIEPVLGTGGRAATRMSVQLSGRFANLLAAIADLTAESQALEVEQTRFAVVGGSGQRGGDVLATIDTRLALPSSRNGLIR